MEEENIQNTVRERLILAGIKELEEHGVRDFSLRRAALLAQVSCAAPYRHFKDKDEYIFEIVNYISFRWQLLTREINSIYSTDPRKKVIELCMANLRFWLANPNFRSVLLMAPSADFSGVRLSDFDGPIKAAIEGYAAFGKAASADIKKYTARALIYGTVMLIGSGEMENNEETLLLVRSKLEEEFC